MIKVGICGFGYWGPVLVRNFAGNRAFRVAGIADRNPEAAARARDGDPSIAVYAEADELIASKDIDAVAIATPVSTHYALAKKALLSGLHVVVEKPLATSTAEAEELIALARERNRVLLVDHVYVFHDAVRRLKELKDNGTLGAVSYYDSLRVNLGLFQPDMNVLWDLAPHDFSIIDHLFGEEPVAVEATGYCHLNSRLPDIAYVTLHYAGPMIAHLNLSWMSPVKVRRIAVGGSRQMAVWDDLNSEEPLKIYNSGIEHQSEAQRNVIVPSYRIGDIHSPRLSRTEPVSRLVAHFAEVIRDGAASPVDGAAGLRVVKLLERAQNALDAALRKGGGKR